MSLNSATKSSRLPLQGRSKGDARHIPSELRNRIHGQDSGRAHRNRMLRSCERNESWRISSSFN